MHNTAISSPGTSPWRCNHHTEVFIGKNRNRLYHHSHTGCTHETIFKRSRVNWQFMNASFLQNSSSSYCMIVKRHTDKTCNPHRYSQFMLATNTKGSTITSWTRRTQENCQIFAVLFLQEWMIKSWHLQSQSLDLVFGNLIRNIIKTWQLLMQGMNWFWLLSNRFD